MHDRRLDGKVHVFGNEGVLFMNAMTWWDHATRSVWSQPWGAAISGRLQGKALTLVPYELVPWSTWVARHPDTQVLVDERGFSYRPQSTTDGFVIGVAIKDAAVGFYYKSVEIDRVRNDTIGEFPVAVFVNGDTREISVLLRDGLGTPADRSISVPHILTFEINTSGVIIDRETGSEWDVGRGIALSGPLRGSAIQRVSFVSSFDWAWEDFFPETTFWGDTKR